MKYNNLVDLIIRMPIYDSMKVDMFDNSEDKESPLSDDLKTLLDALFRTKRIELPCVECNANYPFDVFYDIVNDNQPATYARHFGSMISYYHIDSQELIGNTPVILPHKDEGIVYYTFRCTMDKTHYQKMMLLYTVCNKTIIIRKIGQKPLNKDLCPSLSNEYKKILDKYDSFDDFRFFEQSESRNLLAGSCTYLRRIFEKIINKMLKSESISEESRNKAIHIEDKIALVKDQFDPELKESMNGAYSLLSKGIHELNNNEIEEFYSLMCDFIVNQLEYEKEIDDRKKKKNELKKSIGTMVEKYN